MRLLLRFVAPYVVLLFILCMVSESYGEPHFKHKDQPSYWPKEETANRTYWENLAKGRLQTKLNYYKHLMKAIKPPKNVILFIGDGMGVTSVTIARRFKSQLNSTSTNLNEPLSFENFQHGGLSRTSSFDFHVTDSAAGAMALLSGWKVPQHSLGTRPFYKNVSCIDYDYMINDTIADLAVRKGISVGLVTTDSVTGATPAAMYAKLVHRSYEHDVGQSACPDIAKQMVSKTGIASKFWLIMGGGKTHFFPPEDEKVRKAMSSSNSSIRDGAYDKCKYKCRMDGVDLVEKWEKSGDKKHHFIKSKQGLDNLVKSYKAGERVLGLFARNAMTMHMDAMYPKSMSRKIRETKAKRSSQKKEPSLTEMASNAVKLMNKDNDNGYFLLIEGAQIDKALHGNSAVKSTYELLEFEKAIQKVRDETDPDETLILVTADHSHSISMPGYAEQAFNVLQTFKTKANKTLAGMLFATGDKKREKNPEEQRKETLAGHSTTESSKKEGRKMDKSETTKANAPDEVTNKTEETKERVKYLENIEDMTAENLKDPDFKYPVHIDTQYGYHGGEDVGIWADGPYSWLFSGSLENTEVAYYMKCLLNLIDDNPIQRMISERGVSKEQNGESNGRNKKDSISS